MSRTGPRAAKRCAILTGALIVFARDGYTRASIDAIAGEAGVSTRTIYNHFRDKNELFRTVIEDSATRVAEAQIAIIERHLNEVTDVEAALVAFGCAWRTPLPDYAQHSALVRHINSEVGHIPDEAIAAWRESGPLAVRRELARRFERLAESGLLRIDDPQRAALHFSQLISGADPSYRGASPAELTEVVAAGVHAFLYGYLEK